MEPAFREKFDPGHLIAACQAWGLSTDPLPERFREGESFIYRGWKGDLEVALRLTHPGHRSVDELASELEWMGIVALRGVSTPEIVPSDDGSPVREVSAEGVVWNATAFHWVQGELVNPDHSLWTPETHGEVGRQLGRMQQVSMEHTRAGVTFDRPSGEKIGQLVFGESFQRRFPECSAQVKRLEEELRALPRTESNYGLVHADLHYGNMLCAPEHLYCIDFDDLCYHFFGFDLMIPIYYAVFGESEGIEEAARRVAFPLFRGYKEVGPMAPDALEHAGLFFQLRDFELKYIIDKWGLTGRDSFKMPSRRIEHGSVLYRLPWREWFQGA